MIRAKSALVSAFVTLTASATACAAGLAGPGAARASTTSLCGSDSARVSGGAYVVENDEYGSSASECIRLDGGTGYTVVNSAIANATDGPPGGYPSEYAGCHWGSCTSGGLAASPVPVSALSPGKVTSNWTTVQNASGGDAYDVAYDIWVNRTPKTSGSPNGSEVMIWLGHHGPVQPAGRVVASDVKIGAHSYDVWYSAPTSAGGGDIISYTMTGQVSSVSGLDIGKVIGNSVARGYTKPSWYLISVEAGFELWRGGAGLSTKSFAVTVK